LTALAIAVAVAAVTYALSHVDGILSNLLDTYAKTESGHVRIREKGYTERERSMPVHLSLRNLDEVLSIAEADPRVTAALPRIRAGVLVDGVDTNKPGLLLGVDLAAEEGYLSPSAMVVQGRLPRAGHAEAMVGAGFAENMGVAVGDTLTLLTQTAYRSLGAIRLVVTALGKSGLGALDNRLILTSLDQAQRLIDLQDGATEVVVFARNPDDAEAIAQDLAPVLNPVVPGGAEVTSWTQQGPLMTIMQTTRPMLGIILGILFLMASLIIVNTMMMTVLERTREFGMLAALGMRRSDIAFLILLEGLAIGIIGAVSGGLLGTGIAVWVESTGIDLTAAMGDVDFPLQGIVYPHWTPLYTLVSAGLGMATSVLSSAFPAWRAVRKTPADAMHD
jgi:ABC-type lipoprotein release transport system permease subunit